MLIFINKNGSIATAILSLSLLIGLCLGCLIKTLNYKIFLLGLFFPIIGFSEDIPWNYAPVENWVNEDTIYEKVDTMSTGTYTRLLENLCKPTYQGGSLYKFFAGAGGNLVDTKVKDGKAYVNAQYDRPSDVSMTFSKVTNGIWESWGSEPYPYDFGTVTISNAYKPVTFMTSASCYYEKCNTGGPCSKNYGVIVGLNHFDRHQDLHFGSVSLSGEGVSLLSDGTYVVPRTGEVSINVRAEGVINQEDVYKGIDLAASFKNSDGSLVMTSPGGVSAYDLFKNGFSETALSVWDLSGIGLSDNFSIDLSLNNGRGILEDDYSNNAKTLKVTFINKQSAELLVRSVSIKGPGVKLRDDGNTLVPTDYDEEVLVEIAGNVDGLNLSTQSDVEVKIGSQAVKKKFQISDIANGKTVLVSIPIKISKDDQGIKTLTATVNAGKEISEDNYSNNSKNLNLKIIELCKVIEKGSVVPFWRQNQQPWGAITPFANLSGKTMAGKGCYVTSFAMLLSSYGINTSTDGRAIDPGSVHDGLNDTSMYPQLGLSNGAHSAFDKGGGVIAASAASYGRNAFAVSCLKASGDVDGCIRQSYGRISFKDMAKGIFGDREFDVVQGELCKGNPVILEVPSISKPNDARYSHFVLATGLDIGDDQNIVYRVNNPAGDKDELVNLSEIKGYRRYVPADDPAMIFIYASENVEMLITDPLGRKSGYNPISKLNYDEVPNAKVVQSEAIEDLENINSQEPAVKHFQSLSPVAGTYKVDLFGKKNEKYSAVIYNYDVTGTINKIQDFSGTIGAGGVVSLSLVSTPKAISVRNSLLSVNKAVFLDLKRKDVVFIDGKVVPADKKGIKSIEQFVRIDIGKYSKLIPRKNLRKLNEKSMVYYSSSLFGKNSLGFEINITTGKFKLLINSSDLKKLVDRDSDKMQVQFDDIVASSVIDLKEIKLGGK